MKFSWKISLATMLISLVILSAGGYVLISAMFEFNYQREVESALEENQMMQYSFVAHWSTRVQGLEPTKENVVKTVEAMVQNMKDSRIRISDRNQFVMADTTKAAKDQGLLDTLTAASRGYCLRKTDSGYELQTASMIFMEEKEPLYLETIRDVTGIFEERNQQYNIYRLWMLGILLLESVCCLVMAAWMLRPLKHLTEVTGKLADGQLNVRACVETKDEFKELSDAFNVMADSLEMQVHQLEEAARRQEDFIGSFAHELKTPLTSMIGYADLLRSRDMPEEERLEAANYIFKEGKRLEALSLKLLELLVVQNSSLERKRIPAKWLVKDLEGILRPAMQSKELVWAMQVEDEELFAEPDLLKTVLLNLLDNGQKAMEKGGVLQLLGKREAGGYAFYIKDTGKGMPREEISRITEAFYMIDKSRSRQQGGAGLGLSICTEIVKRHGGTLEFDSETGKGTTVKVFLPKEEME